MRLKVKFFEGQLNQAVEAGIYGMYLSKGNKKRLLYIGESSCVIERASQHLLKLRNDPSYRGLTNETINDPSLTLSFKLLEYAIDNVSMNDSNKRKKREKKLIEEIRHDSDKQEPLLQVGISDRVIKDKGERVRRVNEFIEGVSIMIKRPIHLSHDFLAEVLDDNSIAVDATMGKGNDTAFLAGLAKKVYAFDVQKEALEKTQERLEGLNISNAELILDGHENVNQYVTESIRAAVFNLGYLPTADKSIITKPDTTLSALSQLCDLLEVGGRIAIMIYYGHEGGDMEKDAVLDFVKGLDQTLFTVMLYQPLNQINTPPFLVMLEKLK